MSAEDNIFDFRCMEGVCFPEDTPIDPHPKKDIWWWFAYVDGERAGFACLTRGFKVKHLGYLAWAGVMPKYRGRGIQRLLIRARLKQAKTLGLQRVITYTLRSNPASSNNLIKEGFQLYMPSPGWNMGRDALYWRRKLTSTH